MSSQVVLRKSSQVFTSRRKFSASRRKFFTRVLGTVEETVVHLLYQSDGNMIL